MGVSKRKEGVGETYGMNKGIENKGENWRNLRDEWVSGNPFLSN